MGDMLADAGRWLADVQRDYVSSLITYKSGSTTITMTPGGDPLVARYGATTYQELLSRNVADFIEVKDFIVHVADLAIGTKLHEPRKGEYVIVADGSITLTYEVVHGSGGRPWDYEGADHYEYRIHTKLVRKE